MNSFPAPPQKIACGLYQSACIANESPVKGTKLDPSGKISGAEYTESLDRVYTWGRNAWNVCGDGDPKTHEEVLLPLEIRESLLPRSPVEDKDEKKASRDGGIGKEDIKVGSVWAPYEVACGANHSLFLVKDPYDLGGDIYAMGLGNRGRLGAKDPRAEGEGEAQDTWFCPSGEDSGNDKGRADPKNANIALLVEMPSRHSVLRIACGADHSMCVALLGTGQALYSWGLNTEGQLGTGNTQPVFRPTQIRYPGSNKGVQVGHFACGARHSLMCTAILEGGAGNSGCVYSWGCNSQGRLGLGHSRDMASPTIVDGVKSLDIKRVACGEGHSGCFSNTNCLFMWGAGSYGRLGLGEAIDVPVPRMIDPPNEWTLKSLCLGGFHSACLTGKPIAKVYTWGMGEAMGTLPAGDTSLVMKPRSVPIPDNSFGAAAIVLQIAAGTYHTMVLLAAGDILAFGLGSSGRLGTGRTKNESLPKLIKLKGFTRHYMQKHWATYEHPSERSKVQKVEEEDEGQNAAPWGIRQVACGLMHTNVVTQAGGVYSWGWPQKGQLGLGRAVADHGQGAIWIPRMVDVAKPVRHIATGYEHCLAITQSNDLYAWGRGEQGQLGIGPSKDAYFPTIVQGHAGPMGDVLDCSCGEEHSVAVQKGDKCNTVWAWGSAEMGKLGLGNANSSGTQPQVTQVKETYRKEVEGKVTDDGNPLSVHCGQNHTIVIVEDRDEGAGRKHVLWSCGGGWYGRLGLGDRNNYYQLTKARMDASARSVSCGAYHSASISLESKEDPLAPGQLYVWGRQSMVCHQEDILEPTAFTYFEGASKCVVASCGMMHTMVVTDSQEIFVWGENQMGQLGLAQNNRDHHSSPEQMKTLPGSVLENLLATGPMHTMAVLQNGDLFGWGNQSCGRLGLLEKTEYKVVGAPMKVRAEWASIEAMSGVMCFTSTAVVDTDSDKGEDGKEEDGKEAKDTKGGGGIDVMLDSIKSGQRVQEFGTIQTLLKQEQEAAKEALLRKKEDDLIRKLTKYVEDIGKIPDQEKELDRLKSDITQSFGSNLKYNGGKQIKAARGHLVRPEIKRKLVLYEELLWVLQQQAVYLAQLSMNIKGEDVDIFMDLIQHLYNDLDDPRTLHLFMAMLKTMIYKEIEREKELKNVFKPETSIVFRVFSWFALKEVHYKGVIHKLMDTARTIKPIEDHAKSSDLVKACLLGAVVEATNQDKKFVLTLKDFKKLLEGEEARDVQEIAAEFNQGLERFKEFILGDFMRTIKNNDLHGNLRKVWAHCYEQLTVRGFQPDSVNVSITAELQVLMPILNLFVEGMLIPLLRNPTAYAGKEVFLPHCAKDVDYEPVKNNCKGLADFLSSMMQDDGSGADLTPYNNNRLLASVAKSLKPDLLKHLKDQAEIEDDTDTMLIIDVYVAHFERSPHIVSVPTSVLLRISNILKREQAKIQLHSKDTVGRICTAIGEWEPDMLDAADKNNVLHNFQMRTRFLFDQVAHDIPPLVIDRTSKCPLPYELSSSQGQAGDDSIISRYTVNVTSADTRAKRVLEDLFREVETVQATNFNDLRKTFNLLLDNATKKSPPNYTLARKLSDGLKCLDELDGLECRPEHVLDFIGRGLSQRKQHLLYLEQVSEGMKMIQEARTAYAEEIARSKTNLNNALKNSVSLKLPRPLIEAARDKGVSLEYDKIATKLQALSQFGRQPELLKKCSYTPVVEQSIAKLKKQGVVVSVEGSLRPMEHGMRLTFMHTSNGGIDVSCNVQQKSVMSTVKHISLNADKLAELRRAEEGDKVMLPEDDEVNNIVFNSVGLVRLIVKLSTGM